MCKIPDYKKVLERAESWRVDAYRYTVNGERVWVPKKERTQSTISRDDELLTKLGLNVSDNVLYIAGYYGTWANALAEAGAQVTYTELADDILEFAREKYRKNKNVIDYLCANFATIPSAMNEFDWTFSFEPVSRRSGLIFAMMRGLLNRNGAKIVHYPRSVIPYEKFSEYELIAKVYDCKFERKEVFIKGITSQNESLNQSHIVTTLETNEKARQIALKDIGALENDKYEKDTIKRLNQLSRLFDEKYLKDITN